MATAVAAARYGATAVRGFRLRRRAGEAASERLRGGRDQREVLPPGSVDSSTVFVLANELDLLQGDQPATFTASFHTPDSTVVRVSFMTTGRFEFKHHIAVYLGFRALKLTLHAGTMATTGSSKLRSTCFSLSRTAPLSTASPISINQVAATPEFIKSHTPAAKVHVGQFMGPEVHVRFRVRGVGRHPQPWE